MQQKKRRIAFIHDEFPGGGGERVTIDVANFLVAAGCDVFVFAGKFCKEKVSSEITLNLQVIELPERYVEQSKIDADAIVESVNRLNINVLVSVGRRMLFINDILQKTHCKYVYALHSIPFWEAELILDRARRRGMVSWISKLEWYLISYPKYVWFKKAFRKIRAMYKETYQLADRYVVLCDAYKDELIRRLSLDAHDTKLRVIPNSERKVKLVNWDKKQQLLFVGRMSYVDKRVDRLIDIWRKIFNQLPDWELILVGDGEEREKLEKKVKLEGLERVRFVGFSDNVGSYYREAAILCLVSTFEGWPLCLTEAQANGVVPIAFDCSAGVHHILSPSGKNGVLIPPFDLDRYADSLLKLIKNPELLQEMRNDIVKKAEEYSIDVVGRRWIELLDELCV